MRTEKQTLTDYEIENSLKRFDHFLFRINGLVDWDRVKDLLKSVDPQRINVAGRDSYEPVKMFRIMLLQAWYDLSDPQMEQHLHTDLLFMIFCGFSVTEAKPDHTTICRWRARMTKDNLFEKIFHEIMQHLRERGLEVKQGKMVDATLVLSQARPRKKVVIETEPVGDEAISEKSPVTFQATDINVQESVDKDARWLSRGGQSYFGFKSHVEVDQNGIIETMIFTSANVHDTTMFSALLEQSELSAGDIVYADKGYHSEANKEFLKHRNLTDKIMHKRKRNEPEDEEIKQRNKAISQTRSIIERVFGTLKRSYGWARTRYIGLPKTAAYLLIRGLAYNLKRAEKILSLTPL